MSAALQSAVSIGTAREKIEPGLPRRDTPRPAFTPMGFWSTYRSSLKPLEVEEPVDVWIHRPLAHVVARACFPLGISPNAITLLSIVAGVAAGVALVWDRVLVGGVLLFASVVLDCADGQLARMRGTSSAFGRMLDGTADLITTGVVVPATAFLIWRMFATPWWAGVTAVALSVVTIVTSSFHTTMYDHYKNVFLHMTGPTADSDDYEAARARYDADRRTSGLLSRLCYPIYLFYLKSQRDYVLRFDPYTSARLTLYPAYDPERGAVYREVAGPVMRVWKSVFGFGTLMFGLAVFDMVRHPEIYLLLRLVLFNLVFYGYLRPAQRRASREAFARMGIALPDQKKALA
jgi:phosphatidylglycerophosphate synthase